MTSPRSLPVLVATLLLVACGGTRSSTDRPAVDSGVHNDAGSGDVDMGSTTPDLGTPEVDMGSATPDLGTPDVDMGSTDVDMGSTGSGACTNSADMTIITGSDVVGPVGDCAMSHTFDPDPAIRDCIVGATGLSNPCADCYAQAVHCAVTNCALDCFGGDSPACTMCRATNCDPAFAMCSGLST